MLKISNDFSKFLQNKFKKFPLISTYLLLCANLVSRAFSLKLGNGGNALRTIAYVYRYLWMAINDAAFFLSYSTQWPSFCWGEEYDSGRIFLSSWGTVFAFSSGLYGCDKECIYDNWKVTTMKRREDTPSTSLLNIKDILHLQTQCTVFTTRIEIRISL